MRNTRIVCTLGPASDSPEVLDRLIAAGLDCARLNFSHGSHEGHARLAANVRAAAARAGRPVALLADLSGPKMRIGTFPGGPITLVPGAPFTLTPRAVAGDVSIVSMTYAPLSRDVHVGEAILLDDGKLRLRVVSIGEGGEGREPGGLSNGERAKGASGGPVGREPGGLSNDVHCVVEIGGVLSDRKGINVPGAALSARALSEKDKDDLAFAVGEIGVELVALSFVRRASDIREAQALSRGTPVIAKIEKPQAIDALDEILDAADGAMVARGDLGVELGPEKVPLLQKRIIREVNRRGKLVITATQMLDSMVSSPRPTRAEASDVANAVLDGTDAVMLSNETASGQYPVEAVQMMAAIIDEVERGAPAPEAPGLTGDWGFENGAARAAALLSRTVGLAAIVVYTRDGRTARLLSEYRPTCPILALAPTAQVAQRLAIEWGVFPRLGGAPESPEALHADAREQALAAGFARAGDTLVVVAGFPRGVETNGVHLLRV